MTDLKAARGEAQRRLDEICRLLVDGPNSLAEVLARAQRAGMEGAKVEAAFAAVRAATFEAAEAAARYAALPTTRLGAHRVML